MLSLRVGNVVKLEALVGEVVVVELDSSTDGAEVLEFAISEPGDVGDADGTKVDTGEADGVLVVSKVSEGDWVTFSSTTAGGTAPEEVGEVVGKTEFNDLSDVGDVVGEEVELGENDGDGEECSPDGEAVASTTEGEAVASSAEGEEVESEEGTSVAVTSVGASVFTAVGDSVAAKGLGESVADVTLGAIALAAAVIRCGDDVPVGRGVDGVNVLPFFAVGDFDTEVWFVPVTLDDGDLVALVGLVTGDDDFFDDGDGVVFFEGEDVVIFTVGAVVCLVGLIVGEGVVFLVGNDVGRRVPFLVGVGVVIGERVALSVGVFVGFLVGAFVGGLVCFTVGDLVFALRPAIILSRRATPSAATSNETIHNSIVTRRISPLQHFILVMSINPPTTHKPSRKTTQAPPFERSVFQLDPRKCTTDQGGQLDDLHK